MDLVRELTNRYLLGTASDAEDEEIAVRIIEEPSFGEEVSQAEYDLIEDYLEGALSTPDNELFERQYLNSVERRERVREIALLKRYATRSVEIAPFVEPTLKTIPWYRNFRILIPAFGVVILLIVASVLFVGRGSIDGVDYARLNRENLRDSSVIANSQVVSITPGTYRAGTPDSVSVVVGNSTSVLFRLLLTFEVDPNTVFDASIERDGKSVFEVESVRLYPEDGTQEARLLAPRAVLLTGVHQIRLVERGSDNAPILYTFDVR